MRFFEKFPFKLSSILALYSIIQFQPAFTCAQSDLAQAEKAKIAPASAKQFDINGVSIGIPLETVRSTKGFMHEKMGEPDVEDLSVSKWLPHQKLAQVPVVVMCKFSLPDNRLFAVMVGFKTVNANLIFNELVKKYGNPYTSKRITKHQIASPGLKFSQAIWKHKDSVLRFDAYAAHTNQVWTVTVDLVSSDRAQQELADSAGD